MTLSSKDLDRYFQRIGCEPPTRPDLTSFVSLHRYHCLAVPFENLDVQLGVPLDISIDAAFDKIVARRRGGWCYEQNGVFGAVLEALGYEVTRVAAGVMMHERGEHVFGNHLCLLVRCPDSGQDYLADVGYGGSMLEPIPLEHGEHRQPPYTLALSKPRENWLRFSESVVDDSPFCFDFQPKAANETLLASKCTELQESPDSSFVLSLVAQRRTPIEHLSLRGRVLRSYRATGCTERLMDSPRALLDALNTSFGLHVPEIEGLWPRICARHEELFGSGR